MSDKGQGLEAAMKKVAAGMRITKITCTRSVSGPGGETFIGYSAAWDSVQGEEGRGMDDRHPIEGEALSGFTPKESRLASLLLGMQCDIAAYQNAASGGTLPVQQAEDSIRSIKNKYSSMIREEFRAPSGRRGEGENS